MLDAAAQGASTAVMLVLNIAASLIAFLSFVAFLNAIIGKTMLQMSQKQGSVLSMLNNGF